MERKFVRTSSQAVALCNHSRYNRNIVPFGSNLMPILHVRNVPDQLYERIRQQAQQQNRSISAEVIILLNKALDQAELSQAELLANIRRRRFFRPSDHGAPD